MTVFFRLIQEADKGEVLRRLCRDDDYADAKRVFIRESKEFAAIPGTPFAYWALEPALKVYRTQKSFEERGNFAGQGVATADNFRFIRLHWEVCLDEMDDFDWFGLAKGGAAKKYYGDIYLKIRWSADGAEFKAWAETLYDNSHWSRITMNYGRYGLHGLTWSRRSMAFAVRALPAKCVFGDKGPAIFTATQTADSLLCTCALLNSKPYKYLLGLQLSRVDLAKSYETGIVCRTPFPTISQDVEEQLASYAHDLWKMLRTINSKNEISNAFLLPLILLQKIKNINSAKIYKECALLEEKIDSIAFQLYGLEEQRREVSKSLGGSDLIEVNSAKGGEAGTDEDDEDAVDVSADDAAALLSWAAGVSFGRFDIRLATGQRAIPPDPEPFDLLPAKKSPGMLPNGDTPFKQCSGVLVDDQGHENDFVAHVTAVYDHVGEPAPEPNVLRQTLAREFFPAHIKMYSKSRRRAPIYWQLATPSASYSVWLYVHAFTKDTLLRVQNDYVVPKLAHEQRQLEALRVEAGQNPSGPQHKSITTTESFVEELQAFLEVVERVAQLWNPNLDDGVIINFAPLWRLVPQHKSWQNELKTTWNALCAGTYDWTHLAMHLWPERVVPKCAEDRSLAIAHGLEELFWFEDEEGKWKPYEEPQQPIGDLVRERTSTAVKAALKSLLDAPEPASGAKRSRKPKAA